MEVYIGRREKDAMKFRIREVTNSLGKIEYHIDMWHPVLFSVGIWSNVRCGTNGHSPASCRTIQEARTWIQEQLPKKSKIVEEIEA